MYLMIAFFTFVVLCVVLVQEVEHKYGFMLFQDYGIVIICAAALACVWPLVYATAFLMMVHKTFNKKI